MTNYKDISTMDFSFSNIPSTYEEFISLSESDLDNPFETAALTVLAFCAYPNAKEEAIKMLNYLRGPRELSTYDKQFIADRFMDGKDYIPRSYLHGATPENDYTASKPYTVTIFASKYSYQEEFYTNLYINSSGADNPRSIKLRMSKDGKWYLWEQFILVDVRKPESNNPWA